MIEASTQTSATRKLCGQGQRLFPGYEEGASSEFARNRNKQSGGVPVAIDNAAHAPTGTIKFEDTVTFECHEEYSLDDTVDGNTSFMTTRGAASNSSVAVSPIPGSSEETSCRKATCDVPLAASFYSFSVETEGLFHDVMTYTCETGKSVTGLVRRSRTFERRHESCGDLSIVGSGAESCQPVSCDTISPSDAPHATIPTSLFVGSQSALVTCDAHYSTDTTNWQASSGMLSGLDTATCDEGSTLTGLGEDVNTQNLECTATGHFAGWKECKRVRCSLPPRVVSGALHGCTDCQVYFGGTFVVLVQPWAHSGRLTSRQQDLHCKL